MSGLSADSKCGNVIFAAHEQRKLKFSWFCKPLICFWKSYWETFYIYWDIIKTEKSNVGDGF